MNRTSIPFQPYPTVPTAEVSQPEFTVSPQTAKLGAVTAEMDVHPGPLAMETHFLLHRLAPCHQTLLWSRLYLLAGLNKEKIQK